MKELTEQELIDRLLAIQRAEKIFIESGLTKNMTTAFKAYQAIFAEREREIFLTPSQSKPRSVMDKYERPKCPDCGYEMMFRVAMENDEGIKTQLVCSKKECDTVLNSENDLQWWMDNLKKKVDNGSKELPQGAYKVKQVRRDPRRGRGTP